MRFKIFFLLNLKNIKKKLNIIKLFSENEKKNLKKKLFQKIKITEKKLIKKNGNRK